jgi:hypothetical protein
MSHKSEAEYIERTHNTARFFTEHRQVAMVLLIAVCMWGWYGYKHMPKRKDPSIPVRVAVASTAWPGATAQEVEQLVTRQVEQVMAMNAFIKPPLASDFGIRSMSFPGFRWSMFSWMTRSRTPRSISRISTSNSMRSTASCPKAPARSNLIATLAIRRR